MCGIAGLIGAEASIVQSGAAAMSAAISHRGPDAEGLEVCPFGSQFVGLAHRRLSILDLSALGHQPMVHEPKDTSSIRAGIDRLVSDAELRNRSIDLGFENVKRFQPDVIARQYLAIYEEVLRGKSP